MHVACSWSPNGMVPCALPRHSLSSARVATTSTSGSINVAVPSTRSTRKDVRVLLVPSSLLLVLACSDFSHHCGVIAIEWGGIIYPLTLSIYKHITDTYRYSGLYLWPLVCTDIIFVYHSSCCLYTPGTGKPPGSGYPQNCLLDFVGLSNFFWCASCASRIGAAPLDSRFILQV